MLRTLVRAAGKKRGLENLIFFSLKMIPKRNSPGPPPGFSPPPGLSGPPPGLTPLPSSSSSAPSQAIELLSSGAIAIHVHAKPGAKSSAVTDVGEEEVRIVIDEVQCLVCFEVSVAEEKKFNHLVDF